jgi:MinD-like ATPase involved in chromosome partitioning or flagellar assembly
VLSERTARTLPAKLTAIERVHDAFQALRGNETFVAATPPASAGVPAPGVFALPARASLRVRIRDAWESTEDHRRLERMIISPRLLRCATIAVVSPKGGVGKTTTAALLGSLLAFLRRDRVIAIDTNPDWGSLGRRLAPGHTVFIDDLLAGPLAKSHPSAIELDARLGRGPDGLMIAPAPTDPERASRLDETAYCTLFERLAGLVGTLILDCGTGLDSPAARAALACSDQLMLVTDGEPDTASLVAEAAERRLAPHAPALVLVVNKLDRSSRVDVTALERRIDFADGLVLVPNQRAGADALHGSHFSWNHAPSSWQTAFRELAALLAAGWLRRDVAR